MATLTFAAALNAALADEMAADDMVVVFGEDVGTLGGVFRITEGLQKDFGEHRVLDTPLAESGIVGTAVGLALRAELHQLADLGATTVQPVVAHMEEHARRLAIQRRDEAEAAVVVPFADLAEPFHRSGALSAAGSASPDPGSRRSPSRRSPR